METHEEERDDEGTFLYSGGTGAVTVIWFLLCAGFIFWLFLHGI